MMMEGYDKFPLDAKRRVWLMWVLYADREEWDILGKPKVQRIVARWLARGERAVSDDDWDVLHGLAMHMGKIQ